MTFNGCEGGARVLQSIRQQLFPVSIAFTILRLANLLGVSNALHDHLVGGSSLDKDKSQV